MIKRLFYFLITHKIFREKLLFYLKQNFYHELDYFIPIKSGYVASLLQKDSYDSFSEIFIKREYDEFIPDVLISRIIDIGAHYGYFSLWLQSENPQIELQSLLIEASPICTVSLNQLCNNKKLFGKFRFLSGAIGKPDQNYAEFYDREYMAGSTLPTSRDESTISVKIIQEDELLKEYEPPYSLIKCDIEGSEWQFLNHYQNLINSSEYLLLEWHSWHTGGGGLNQIKTKLNDLGFDIERISHLQNAVGRDGTVGLILAKNKKVHS